jgi:hypothetical protein
MVWLDFRYYLMYYFIYLFVFLILGRCHLDVVDFDNLQDLEQQAGEQGKCSLIMLNPCSFSLQLHICLHALI